MEQMPFELDNPQKLSEYLTQRLDFLPSVLRMTNDVEFNITTEFLNEPRKYFDSYLEKRRESQQKSS